MGGGHLASEVRVRPPHRSDGIANQLVVLEVEEGLRPPAIPHRRRLREARRRLLRPPARDPVGVDLVAQQAARDGDEAGLRSHHLEGVAVGEDELGVGVLGEQRFQSEEMGRRLEHPGLGRRTPLQQLQELAVEAVGGGLVAAREPRAVGGDPGLTLELQALELVDEKRHALGGRAGRHRVDHLHLRRQRVQGLQLGVGRLDARIRRTVKELGRRARLLGLPVKRRSGEGVQREQVVQQGGPGPGQAEDEDRPLDHLFQDLGMPEEPVVQLQPVHEKLGEPAANGSPTQGAQPGLLLVGAHEEFEPLVKGRISEIVESRLPGGLLEKALRRHRAAARFHRFHSVGTRPAGAGGPTSSATADPGAPPKRSARHGGGGRE